MADFQGDSSTSFHDSHEIPEKRRKLDDEPLIIGNFFIFDYISSY